MIPRDRRHVTRERVFHEHCIHYSRDTVRLRFMIISVGRGNAQLRSLKRDNSLNFRL